MPRADKPAAMTAGQALPSCDCLVLCGDDKRVAAGTARECNYSIELRRELADVTERFALERELAIEAAIGRVHFGALRRYIDGEEWLAMVGDAARLTQAIRYLVQMKRAEQHPTQPHLVRLTPTPRSTPA